MRLGLAVGRPDWENLAKEMTPYQIQVWRAYEQIEPFGERRADMRMAVQTMNLLQAQSASAFTEDQTAEIVSKLMNYVGSDDRNDREPTPEQAAKLGKAAFARIGIS